MSFDRLANEIILMIASHLDDKRDINALATTSRNNFTTLNLTLYRFDADNVVENRSVALCWAAYHGKKVAFKSALEARPITHGLVFNSAIHALQIVAANGNLDMIKELFSKGIPLNEKSQGHSAVQNAIRHGQTAALEWMIENGGDLTLSWPDDYRQTALHVATIGYGSLEVTKFLLKHGLDVNACDSNKETPLINALSCRQRHLHYSEIPSREYNSNWIHKIPYLEFRAGGTNIELIQLLVDHGADLHARDKSRNTPWDYMCSHHDVEVRMLFNKLQNHKMEKNIANDLKLA